MENNTRRAVQVGYKISNKKMQELHKSLNYDFNVDDDDGDGDLRIFNNDNNKKTISD